MIRSIANSMRRMWVLAVVLIAGFAFHPSAFATVDSCSGNNSDQVVDSAYDVEQIVCAYGDTGSAYAWTEVDFNGYYTQSWDTTILEAVSAEVVASGYGGSADSGTPSWGNSVTVYTPSFSPGTNGAYIQSYYSELIQSLPITWYPEWNGPYAGISGGCDFTKSGQDACWWSM